MDEKAGGVDEKTKVRRQAILSLVVLLPVLVVVHYFIEGEFFGPSFIGNIVVLVFFTVVMILFPEPFTRSETSKRRREWKENRAGRILLFSLAALLLSLGALLLNSYLNGYRM